MGQRHQLFVVAKIRNRYRTLAVAHRQWLYEMGPVERCLRLIQIFQAGPNQIPIKQELRAACEKDDDFWTTDSMQPFPFIATCLLVGSSFEPEDGYQHRVHSLPFNVTLDQIDNNDGITIIDLSDTKNIRYCFAFLDDWPQKPLKPLSANGYLVRYETNPGRDEDEDEDEHSEIEEEKYRMITKDILRNWLNPTAGDDKSLDHDEQQAQLVGTKQSLREQTMEQLIDTLLRDPDHDPDAMAEARHLPDFASKLRNKISSLAAANELPSSPALVRCLGIAFDGQTAVDLSSMTQITPGLLVEAISSLLESGIVKSLDLSHLRQLSEKDLEGIVRTKSGLETLYILQMPQISLLCVGSLWAKNTAFKEIYHTDLFGRPLNLTHRYSNLVVGLQSPCITDTRNPIKNILFARVLSKMYNGEPNLRKDDGITVDWQRSELGLSGSHEENHMFFSVFPINDMLLTPTKIVNGLVNFLRCASIDSDSCALSESYLAGYTMVKSFASASPYKTDDSTTIGPFPNLLYKACSTTARTISPLWPVPFPYLCPGELSIVIINEQSPSTRLEKTFPSKFRLAVISPKTADKSDGYRVQSLEAYLEGLTECSSGIRSEEVAALLQYWKQRMSFVGSCEAAEIDELLPTAEKNLEKVKQSCIWGNVSRAWDRE
ncbi:MAG: hypothetical protein L6R38_008118 [Xanthoria sp. 2 TBL-2021]|nr:MAG: hypothetical protein L6R38_008118 [Xanthoria sp. 2 TBL-2021]